MSRIVEPFARDKMMRDLRDFIDAQGAPETYNPQPNPLSKLQIAFSPAFDTLYVEYLETVFEDYFVQNMPLQDLLETLYREDKDAVAPACETLRTRHPELFEDEVVVEVADSVKAQNVIQSQYYDRAIALLDVILTMDEITADPDPGEREKQASAYVVKTNEQLQQHFRLQKRLLGTFSNPAPSGQRPH
ncbi:MAG: hypothetical protein H6867_08185 [Rhodospirillales bacterium]|nr:hypothetical protein [Rhodospirillales bacterium]MCB9995534.1 hypothetical protein [Rhodospirillales bacterium]